MKKVISIILSVFLVFSLISQAFFISVQQKFALIPTAKALSFSKEDLERYSSMSTSDLHKEFDSYIIEEGLPTEILDYVVEDPEFTKSVEDFKNDYLEYAKGNTTTKPQIDTNKVTSIIDNSIAKYNEDNNAEITFDSASKISETISEKINEVAEVMDSNPTLNKVISLVYNENFQIISVIATITLVVLLVIINRKKVFNYIGIPSLISSIVLIALYFLKNIDIVKLVTNFLGDVVSKIFTTLLVFGIVYLIIGIMFIIINIILNKKTEAK